MSVFIKGCASITAQNTFEGNGLGEEAREFKGDNLIVQEPDYEGLIDPRAIRRMSKIIRISVASAQKALSQAGVKVPDGIITGTSYGCLEDTENFLHKLIDNKEEALNPTPFIQSTHNTISGQIALLLKCYGYNSTYTQRGFSFENCLLDVKMQLDENPQQNILTGGVDEIIPVSHDILRRFNLYREQHVSNLNLMSEPLEGTLNGEGGSYFVLSGNSEGSIAEIVATATLYRPNDDAKVIESLTSFLGRNNIDPADIDVLLLGKSGDSRHDKIYNEVSGLFENSTVAVFKHLCGEFPTASAFATWVAAQIIKEEKVPELIMEKKGASTSTNKVLIYNNYFGVHHSFILLKGEV